MTEEYILSGSNNKWGKNRLEEIAVSVLCMTFNHGQYIKRALDSFIAQKTDFLFEIIVHDADYTTEILKEYELKYQTLIKVIFQKENQYSKGINIIREKLLPSARGKYIAFCEGDDYWSDEYKLQKQYNYMEENPGCSICLHNTVRHDINGEKRDSLFHSWKRLHILDDKEIFFGWKVHTSSYFMRKEFTNIRKEIAGYWFGDYVYLTWAANFGSAAALPDIMSVYNCNVPAGVTSAKNNLEINSRIKRNRERAEYLALYNDLTGGKYESVIYRRIREIEFYSDALKDIVTIKNTRNPLRALDSARKIRRMPSYKTFYETLNLKKKLITSFKFGGYAAYPLWKSLWKRRFSGGV